LAEGNVGLTGQGLSDDAAATAGRSGSVPVVKRWTGSALTTLLLTVSVLSSCSDPAGPNGRFCDVVKRIRATFDPLTRTELYSDPKVLRAGMDLRLQAYNDLLNEAPVEIKGDATIARDAFVRISQLLRDKGDVAASADDPVISALINDKTRVDAELSLQRFANGACKDTAPVSISTTVKKP
jgi:hypothetical protein